MLDRTNEGNIKTKTSKEAMRLIKNLVSSNNTKTADMHMKKLATMVTRSLRSRPKFVLYMKSRGWNRL